MSITYEELKKQKEQETLSFHNIDKWHELGYEGQGFNFLEIESEDTHGIMVRDTFKLVGKKSNAYLGNMRTRVSGDEVLYCDINYYGTYIPIKQFVEELNIHIIGASLSSDMPQALKDYLKELPVIFVGSAGNEGSEGVTGKFEGLGFMSGAIYLDNGEIKKERYSGVEDTMDFATLHGAYEGTSFSSPVLAGMIAVIMSKYGIMTQSKMKEALISICVDAGEEGKDDEFGYGVPILPKNGVIDMLEESEVDDDMTIEGRYTVRYAHLDRILVSEGDMVNPTLPWKAATPIGVMGNTGLSTAAHLHIDVVKYWQFELWKLLDMYNGNKTPSKQELDFFVSPNDDTLFKVNPIITTQYDEQEYANTYGVRHLGYDAVPENRKYTTKNFTVYWNRSFAGRVLKTGYDNAYGNYVLVGYDTLSV